MEWVRIVLLFILLFWLLFPFSHSLRSMVIMWHIQYYYYWNYLIATVIEVHYEIHILCLMYTFPIVVCRSVLCIRSCAWNRVKEAKSHMHSGSVVEVNCRLNAHGEHTPSVGTFRLHDCVFFHRNTLNSSNEEWWTWTGSIVRWFVIDSEWIKWIEKFIDFRVVQLSWETDKDIITANVDVCVLRLSLQFNVSLWMAFSIEQVLRTMARINQKRERNERNWNELSTSALSLPFLFSISELWRYHCVQFILPFKKPIVRVARNVNITDGFESRTLTQMVPLRCGRLQLLDSHVHLTMEWLGNRHLEHEFISGQGKNLSENSKKILFQSSLRLDFENWNRTIIGKPCIWWHIPSDCPPFPWKSHVKIQIAIGIDKKKTECTKWASVRREEKSRKSMSASKEQRYRRFVVLSKRRYYKIMSISESNIRNNQVKLLYKSAHSKNGRAAHAQRRIACDTTIQRIHSERRMDAPRVKPLRTSCRRDSIRQRCAAVGTQSNWKQAEKKK